MTKKSKFHHFKRRLASDGLSAFAAGVRLPGEKTDPAQMSESELIAARRLSRKTKAKERRLKRDGAKRQQQLTQTGALPESVAAFAGSVRLPGR